MLFLVLIAVLALLSLWVRPVTEDTVTFGRFGAVTIYRDRQHPSQVILFVSGEYGWNQAAAANARALAAADTLVVGIDLPRYLQTVSRDQEPCAYTGGDFDALSKFIQQTYTFPQYVRPVLVGVAEGAALVYATVAQAPPEIFRGVITLGFCPELKVSKPLCAWNNLKWRPQPNDNTQLQLTPEAPLSIPWTALHGGQDHVCPAITVEPFVTQVKGTYIPIPQVGHDFSVPATWVPQFQHAYAQMVTPPAVASSAGPLADLPLIEVPTTAPDSQTLAVIWSGDGGWASIDRQLADTLASHGVAVVGVNSLRYFWTPRTPDEAAKDLERLVQYYLAAWHKTDVLLIGYSRGADVLPFLANRLPSQVLRRVRTIALLGPAPTVTFEFHLTDWLQNAPAAGQPVLPELAKLRGKRLLCAYGAEEQDSLCTSVDPALVEVLRLPGGHHFDGGYDLLAERIVREAGITNSAQDHS